MNASVAQCCCCLCYRHMSHSYVMRYQLPFFILLFSHCVLSYIIFRATSYFWWIKDSCIIVSRQVVNSTDRPAWDEPSPGTCTARWSITCLRVGVIALCPIIDSEMKTSRNTDSLISLISNFIYLLIIFKKGAHCKNIESQVAIGSNDTAHYNVQCM